MNYGIGSRDYLSRAKFRLAEGGKENLFYAAFELRCGIEARLQAYLHASEQISEKKKQGWRVADLARNLENAFKLGNRIVRCAVHDKDLKLLICFYFTPVTSQLKKAAEKLGNHLHCMRTYRDSDDSFWTNLRQELGEIVAELEIATTGTLLGPLLMKRGSTETKITIEFPREGESRHVTDHMKGEILVRIDYLATLPTPLEKEAHVWTG